MNEYQYTELVRGLHRVFIPKPKEKDGRVTIAQWRTATFNLFYLVVGFLMAGRVSDDQIKEIVKMTVQEKINL